MATSTSKKKTTSTAKMKKIETPTPPPTIPAQAKKPQDRKKKAEDPNDDRVVVIRGVEVDLPADALDDFELLDDISELEHGNGARLPRILRRLAGDSYRDLLDAVRDEQTDKVSLEAGGSLVEELLEALDPN